MKDKVAEIAFDSMDELIDKVQEQRDTIRRLTTRVTELERDLSAARYSLARTKEMREELDRLLAIAECAVDDLRRAR